MLAGATPPGEAKGSKERLGLEELYVAVVWLLLIIGFLVRGWMEEERPRVDGSLQASVPVHGAPFTFRSTASTGVRGGSWMKLRAIRVNGFPAEGRGSSAPSMVEVVLPVPPRACVRWARQTGHGCGRPFRVKRPWLTLVWHRAKLVHFRLRYGGWWRLAPADQILGRGAPAKWSVESAAASIVIYADCLHSVGFNLVTAAGAIRSRCEEGQETLRLVVAADEDENLPLDLDGLANLEGHATAGLVEAGVDDGVMVAGDRERRILGPETKVKLSSESEAVNAGWKVVSSTPGHLWAHAKAADAVQVGRADLVPTRFEQSEDLWWNVMVGLGGALLGGIWALYRGRRAA